MTHKTHIYYGDGKGKTTAAVGAAVRAAGRGLPVCFAQFMKGGESGEIVSLSRLPGVTILRPKKPYPFYKNMTDAEKDDLAKEHAEIFREICTFTERCGEQTEQQETSSPPALIVCDEILHALRYQLIDAGEVLRWLKTRPAEIILTGREPSEEFLAAADYITEMKAVRHPYQSGIKARIGVEL